jgi:type II secretory pathway component PulF
MKSSVAAVLRASDDGRDRAEFHRMWRMGVSAGLTHPAILATLRTFRGTTREVHAHLLAGTTAGRDVATLVRERRALFEPFEATLLIMGDEAGKLDPVLASLGEFFERQYKMMLAVKKHLAYPMFVSLVAVWLLPLPLVFQGKVGAYFASVAVAQAGWFFFGGSVLAGRAQAYQRRPGFVRARFARALSLALGAGLPLGRAVRLAAGASGDPELVRHVARFDERTLVTQSLATTLAGASIITPELMAAVQVAESTGDLRTTLGRLADLYEDGFK